MALATLRSARASLGGIKPSGSWWTAAPPTARPDAIEQAFPDVRVFRSTNRGFSAGNNVALPHAQGRYVLLLNPDVEVESGTLRTSWPHSTAPGRRDRERAAAGDRRRAARLDPPLPDARARVRRSARDAPSARLSRLQELDTDFDSYGRGAVRRLAGRRVPDRPARGGRAGRARWTSASSSTRRRSTGAAASAGTAGTCGTCRS